jgi:outer membrane protein assembly factor BamB
MAGPHQGWNTALVQRTTPTGYVVWATTCSLESEHPWIRDIARLDGGGYFICGEDFGLGISDTGESLWSRDYSSLGSVDFRAVDTAADGGLFLAGCVYTETGSRIICARVTSTGELVWSRRVDDQPASGWSVCAGSGGSCFVVGGTDESDSDDGIVIKFDASGNIEWKREFNGPRYGSMVSATQAPDGDIVVLGSANEELRVLKVHP